MKTFGTFCAAVLLLLPWCSTTLFSQTTLPASDKKVTIIKRSVDTDGTEVTETIVKKGKAAENFDVDQYIAENKTDKVQLEIRVESGDIDTVTRVAGQEYHLKMFRDDLRKGIDEVISEIPKLSICTSSLGYLGVWQQSYSEEDEEGVPVAVNERGPADKAGLKSGDVIFRLDDANISDWDELTEFMHATKPNQKVTVHYRRKGKENSAVVTLGEQKSWDWGSWSSGDWNWDNFNIEVKDKDACLGVYTTSAEEEGDNRSVGALISDFTEASAAKEASLQQGDIITAVNNDRVAGHDDLWNAISRYEPGDKVNVSYIRDGKPATMEVTLKACQDKANKVVIERTGDDGDDQSRNFFTWNWDNDDRTRMQERQVITIHKGEGDGERVNMAPGGQTPSTDRSLALSAFKAYPNPTSAQVTVTFTASPVATVVSLFDLSGRQLFREELNAFDGKYNQTFDLTEYAKGTIVVHIQQGDKVYTEQVIIN